ncbi:MAG: ABC transporter substrate-binding protein [Caldilineaceae bacterium]
MTRIQTVYLFGLLVILLGIATTIFYTSKTKSSTLATAELSTALTKGNSGETDGTPQPGGTFIEAVSTDADTFNPIYTTNATSLKVIQKLFAPLIGQDAFTGAANQSGLAEKWSFSTDGQELTVQLYAGLKWSDGQPLTTQDLLFTYALLRDPQITSPYHDNFANVVEVTASDERTLVIRLATADCTILQTLRQPVLPAHLYQNDVAHFQAATQRDFPRVGAGPFVYVDRTAGRITLRRNPFYRYGPPLLERYEFQIVPDESEQVPMLQRGEVDLIGLRAAALAQFQPTDDTALYTAPLDSITFVAINLADPNQPQPGRTVDGELLPQTPHPVLAELAVRRALAQSVDNAATLEQVYGKSATLIDSYMLPTITWAYHDTLPKLPYDPSAAAELLRTAGWVDSNGDGIRERAGNRLQLQLLTNEDSPSRVQLGQLLQNQWRAIGIDLQLNVVAFDTLAAALLGQRYDLVLIGWDNLGSEPANSDFWFAQEDLPTSPVAASGSNAADVGGGVNFVSYQNSAVEQWLREARTAPACDGGYRAQRYRRVQERIQEELPYIILGGQRQGWAYDARWQGILPQPWLFQQNIHRWWRQPDASQ